MKKLILIIAILLIPVFCFGQEYYVDFNLGDDSDFGTSEETAWKYHPWMTLASSTSDGTALQPGDTVYLKMGEVWRDAIIVEESGTSGGGDITLARKTDWGTGENPVITTADNYLDSAWAEIDDMGTWVLWGVITGGSNTYGGAKRQGDTYRTPRRPSGTCTDTGIYSENYMFCGWQATGDFYMRVDDVGGAKTKPGEGAGGSVEIGVRDGAFFLDDKSYITIDGITFRGPNGNEEVTGKSNLVWIEGYDFSHITIKNCIIEHSSRGGIQFDGRDWESYTHITFQDNIVRYSWANVFIARGTAAGRTNLFSRNEVYHSAPVFGDGTEDGTGGGGDRSNLAMWRTAGWEVSDNIIHDVGHGEPWHGDSGGINGFEGDNVLITRNYTYNTAKSGIVFKNFPAEPGHQEWGILRDIIISYNIVDRFNMLEGTGLDNDYSNGSGIRIGCNPTDSQSEGFTSNYSTPVSLNYKYIKESTGVQVSGFTEDVDYTINYSGDPYDTITVLPGGGMADSTGYTATFTVTPGPIDNVRIYNNIIKSPYDSTRPKATSAAIYAGFSSGCPVSDNIYIENNYIEDYSNMDYAIYWNATLSGSSRTVKNNFMYQDGDLDTTDATEWFGTPKTVTEFNAASTYISGNEDTDCDLNISGGYVVSLNEGSACIDAGLDLGSPYNIGINGGGTDFTTSPPTVTTLDQDDYDDFEIGAFVYTGVSETPIVISNPLPNTEQSCTSDPRIVQISIDTSLEASCRYSDSEQGDVEYNDMENTYQSSYSGLDHIANISLDCDSTYTFYSRCTNGLYTNPTSTITNFGIQAQPQAQTSGYNGVVLGN